MESSPHLKNSHRYSGCGNTFIIVDHRTPYFPLQDKRYISLLCHQHNVDGILFLERSHRADVKMRIFNADGTEAEMCGNGIRCVVKYVREQWKMKQDHFSIETLHCLHKACINNDMISVSVPTPNKMAWNLPLNVEKQKLTVHYLDTGVPHVVLFSTQKNLGSSLRHHPYFAPKGTNVTFIETHENNTLKIATFERGVEEITQACGTGALAAALAAHVIVNIAPPITVIPPSEEPLFVSFQAKNNLFFNLSLTGPAQFIEEIPFLLDVKGFNL